MLIFVGDQYQHHASFSGYHHLVKLFRTCWWFSERELLTGRVLSYKGPDDLSNGKGLAELVKHVPPTVVFYVLYGDFSPLPKLLRLLFPRARIIVTMHQPIWFLESSPTWKVPLAYSDEIVGVTKFQADELRRIFSSKKVHYLPVGICLSQIRSDIKITTRLDSRVLIVGEHLRDWNVIAQTIRGLPDGIETSMVIPRFNVNIPETDGLEIKLGIDDKELINLYCSCSCLFLPLLDSTANLAILEAMATGCPVVCSDLPGPRASLGEVGLFFRHCDVESARALLRLMCKNSIYRDRISSRSAIMAECYDWNNLKAKYQEVIGYE